MPSKPPINDWCFRIHSRVDFLVILAKLFLVIMFCILQDSSFEIFKVLILIVVSLVTFLKYMIDRPYYSRTMNKVLTISHGIFLWSNCMLFVGYLLNYMSALFNMLLFVYLLGIPIVIAIILTLPLDANLRILLTPFFKI